MVDGMINDSFVEELEKVADLRSEVTRRVAGVGGAVRGLPRTVGHLFDNPGELEAAAKLLKGDYQTANRLNRAVGAMDQLGIPEVANLRATNRTNLLTGGATIGGGALAARQALKSKEANIVAKGLSMLAGIGGGARGAVSAGRTLMRGGTFGRAGQKIQRGFETGLGHSKKFYSSTAPKGGVSTAMQNRIGTNTLLGAGTVGGAGLLAANAMRPKRRY